MDEVGERTQTLASPSKRESIRHANRKFIVTSDGRGFIGKDDLESHPEIARRNTIPDKLVIGGGIVTFGSGPKPIAHSFSGTYGVYQKDVVEKVFPEWEVLEPEIPQGHSE